MPNCTACRDPRREDIETDILDGMPWAAMAQKYGGPPMRYSRHARNCMKLNSRGVGRPIKGAPCADLHAEDVDPSGNDIKRLSEQSMRLPRCPDPRKVGELRESMEGYELLLKSRNYLLAIVRNRQYLRSEEHPEGMVPEDYINWEKTRITAIRELRGVVLTALRVYEAQRVLALRAQESKPWESTVIYKFLEERHPDVLRELLAYMAEVPE